MKSIIAISALLSSVVLVQSITLPENLCNAGLNATCSPVQSMVYSMLVTKKAIGATPEASCLIKETATTCTTPCKWCTYTQGVGVCLPDNYLYRQGCNEEAKEFYALVEKNLKENFSLAVVPQATLFACASKIATDCTDQCASCPLSVVYPESSICLTKEYAEAKTGNDTMCSHLIKIVEKNNTKSAAFSIGLAPMALVPVAVITAISALM